MGLVKKLNIKRNRTQRSLLMQIVFVLLAFAVMAVSSYYFLRGIERDHLEDLVQDTFSGIEALLRAELQEYETMHGTVAETLRGILLLGMSQEVAEGYIRDINRYGHETAELAGLMNVFVMFDIFDGAMYNPTYEDPETEFHGDPDFDPTTRDWYADAVRAGGKPTVTDTYQDFTSGRYAFTYTQEIYDEEGNRMAIVCLDVALDLLYEFSTRNRGDEDSFWTLHDKNHVIIAHPDEKFIGMQLRDVDGGISELADELERGGTVSNHLMRDATGRPVSFSMQPVDNGWFLGVVVYTDSFYDNLSLILFFLIVLGSVLAAGLIAILVSINIALQRVSEEKAALDYLGSILNGLDTMFYVTDPDTDCILFINDNMMETFGLDGSCIGKPCYKVLQRGMDARCSFCPCRRLDEAPDETITWEETSTVTGNTYRNSDRYIDWPNGKKVHIQHSVDISELIRAKESAEQSSRYKSAFLANMSHEVRTPMNAILGIAEIRMQDDKLSSETEEALRKIYDSGSLLLSIVNDILDLSKIEAGKLEIVPVQYDIPSLVNDVVQINRLRYDSKPIDLIIDVDENTPLNLFGDELRLKQVLNNILSNAFKYTDKGEIRLSVFAQAEAENEVCLVFRVSDTGQGMSREQLGELFKEYTRFNLEANRTTVGSGLGLSITKRLLDLMNGEIHVESEVDAGSVFTVNLPQKRVGSLVCGPEMTERLRDFRFQSSSMMKRSRVLREHMPYGSVLVVDDVESNLYVAKGMLMPYGLRIDTADSGFEAIEKVRSGNEYDIIFMDHMMPRMDGIETMKILRDIGYTHYIVALTANALVGHAETFMESGFDGYLSKPIDSRELNHVLNEFIRNKKRPEVVEEARRTDPEIEENGGAAAVHENRLSEVRKYFAIDAENAVSYLEGMGSELSVSDLDTYEITTHGMKSALANIGETELSDFARKLEDAAKEKDLDTIMRETPAFTDALKGLLEKLEAEE